MRGIIKKVLPLVLPEGEGESPSVSIMAREIVSCAVLLPILDQLSDPDLWNRIIDEKVSGIISFHCMFLLTHDRHSPRLAPPFEISEE